MAEPAVASDLVCPCGEDNDAESRYCWSCGRSLTGDTQVTEERRVVTVLFCDLVGFTSLSEQADPEDVQQMLRRYHAAVREQVTLLGGTVERLVGDGVLAVFGVPTVREDDAERAIRCALAVVDAVGRLTGPSLSDSLSVRVGINTGEVLVNLVTRVSAAPWVTGDVVNTASRLQTAAQPGTVVVGERTYRSTSRVFEFIPLPPMDARGKAEPLTAFQVTSARLPRGAEIFFDMSIPLVGRQLELQQLRTTFDRVTADSALQLVSIIGDPGVGKSRMVAELLASMPTVTYCVGKVPPYGEFTGFSALSDIVKDYAGIFDTESPAEATDKLMHMLAGVPDAEWLVGRLLPLVGVDPGVDTTQDESFHAWRRFLENLTQSGPAVVVLEDVHQADVGLLRFILELAEDAPRVPLMVVVTARPELLTETINWGAGLRNASTVDLRPLSNEDTRALLRTLIGEPPLPPTSEQAILVRAEGNPLFTAEYVRMLRDRDLIEPMTNGTARPFFHVPLPETVQGVIAARLGILEGNTRAVLQAAAVIGRVFWTSGVSALTGRDPSEVSSELRRLTRMDIVRSVSRSSLAGEIEHTFTHVLLREAAYDQLVRATRARKHLAAADWLQGRASAGGEDLAEVLAYHASTALELAISTGEAALAEQSRSRLLGFYLQAAEAAESVSALSKALAHVDAAYGLVQGDLNAEPRPEVLLARRARLRWQLGDIARARADAQSAVELATARGPEQLPGPVLAVAGLARTAGSLATSDPDLGAEELDPWLGEPQAVPAGRHAHHPRAGRSTVTAARARDRVDSWEAVISVDRDFFDAGIVDNDFPPVPSERSVSLTPGVLLVGRSRDAAVSLASDPVDPAVSRRHATLSWSPGGWTVTQVAADNPTYLNGQVRLPLGEPVPVNDGDYLNLGGWTRVTLIRATR